MFKLIHALIVTLVPALVWAGPVDINTADAATIAKELQGIGLSRAQAIVAASAVLMSTGPAQTSAGTSVTMRA